MPKALTYIQFPVAPAAAWVALSLLSLVLALKSVASREGTRCGQTPAGCVLEEELLGSRPIFPSF